MNPAALEGGAGHLAHPGQGYGDGRQGHPGVPRLLRRLRYRARGWCQEGVRHRHRVRSRASAGSASTWTPPTSWDSTVGRLRVVRATAARFTSPSTGCRTRRTCRRASAPGVRPHRGLLYSGHGVVGDDTVCNPNRLCPAAGTLKRKGFNDIKLGRVHRLTGI